MRELFRQVPRLEFSISYTTRPPRGSEQHGREYFFVSRPQFEEMIAKGDFLEYAEVFGNYYGTARSFLQQAGEDGRDLVLDIDVQGAAKVRQQLPHAVSIFIAPPDLETLTWRLSSRGLDSQEVMECRLRDATGEIAAYNRYDYVLINDRLEESVDHLRAIVLCEQARVRGWGQVVPGAAPEECGKLALLAEECLQKNVQGRLMPVLRSFGIVEKTMC